MRTGRKRKAGMRKRNGRLVVVDRLSPRAIAAAMPHRRNLCEDVQLNQRAESVLGRMNLRGTITENQYLAGEAWAHTVGAYLATIDPPRALAGAGWKPDVSEQECLERRNRYNAAYEAMWPAGHTAIKAVNRVAINDEACPAWMLSPLRWGLTALVGHYGLTKQRKERSATIQTHG